MNEDLLNNSLYVIEEADRRAKEAGTPLLINFSGGKDSSAVLLLTKMVTDTVEAIYMTSGLELPGTIEFVQKEAARFNVPLHITDPVRDYMGDFEFWVRKYGYFPSFGYNFCNSRLKIRTARAYLRKIWGHKPMYRLNGVRKSESKRRAAMYRLTEPIRPDNDLARSFIVQPIQEWSGQDVKDFLEQENFVVQKDYSSFGVSGCAYCPYYQPEIYYRILLTYPNIYDKLIELENEIGKPAAAGNRFLGDIKSYFLENKEQIISNLNEIKIKK